jgi:hypothetical protein
MGAYVADVFSRMLGKGIGEDAFEKGVSKLEGNSLGRGFLNLTGNKEYELELHPGGQAIKAMNDNYIRVHDQTLGQEIKKINPATAPAVREQQMRAAKGKARLNAISQVYGPHFENATPIIANMLSDKDPRVVMNGHRVADILSNQVKDTRDIVGFGKGTATKGPASYAKASMNKAFMASNKVRDELELTKIPLLNTEATYERQSQAEYAAHRVLNTMLTPFVAIPHVGQLFHIPADSPLPAIGASILRLNQNHAEAIKDASGILSSTLWNTMYRDILGEKGHVSEWTGSPTVGKILARTMHQPGFNWLRKLQLNMAGTVGFHSAIYWAKDFATTGNKRAAAELGEMGIDLQDVIKQGGKLNDDQLTKGVYHYVNNRFFVNREIDNALYQNRNVFTRSMFMYHQFVNSEASYIRRSLLKMYNTGDIKGLAQYAGTLGILFPNIAPLISGAEVMARTASIQQGVQETKQRYQRLYSPNSAGDWFSDYAALLSHIGAAGVYFNYINAIHAHRLVSAMAGPLAGAAGEDIEDVVNAVTTENKAGDHPWKPVVRDALKQTLPVIGSPLAHHLVPTTAEEKSGSSSRSRFGLRRGRRRF